MSDRDFTAAISVDQTPEEAVDAINNVRGWWSENIEGSTDKLGAEFSYRYQDAHFCKIKITELVPGKRIVCTFWTTVSISLKTRANGKNTDIIFEISKRGNKTEVRFTHRGLVPEYECFDVCSNAWGSYINGSLTEPDRDR